jgi:hypothetical protein
MRPILNRLNRAVERYDWLAEALFTALLLVVGPVLIITYCVVFRN